MNAETTGVVIVVASMLLPFAVFGRKAFHQPKGVPVTFLWIGVVGILVSSSVLGAAKPLAALSVIDTVVGIPVPMKIGIASGVGFVLLAISGRVTGSDW